MPQSRFGALLCPTSQLLSDFFRLHPIRSPVTVTQHGLGLSGGELGALDSEDGYRPRYEAVRNLILPPS